jgi:hypothetical protein
MNPSQPISPRRRLQELLAIPDSQRTEAQWDELNELEIKLAPGNRDSSSDGGGGGNREGGPPGPGQGHGQGRPNPRGNPQGKRPARKFHKRPPKPGNNNVQ